MLNKNGERELAYVVRVNDITLMDADRLECAHINGWKCVVGKGEFKPGDLAIYFEIDSKLPEVKPFTDMEFLASKHFKIKSQKIREVISQGLIVSASTLGWQAAYTEGVNGDDYLIDPSEMVDKDTYKTYKEGDFLTKKLNVTYACSRDCSRKAPSEDKYKKMSQRHIKLSKTWWWKKLYRTKLGKKFLFMVFGKKRDKNTAWPDWVAKTDEERIQNLRDWEINYADTPHWVMTEKIDGSSATFTIRRNGNPIGPKYSYYVCSRNVVFDKPNKKCYYDTNIYQDISKKYNIEKVLTDIMNNHPEYKFVTLQGEIFGNKVQIRNYSLTDTDLRLFNLIDSVHGRWNSAEAANFITSEYNIPWVPILDSDFTLLTDRDEMIKLSNGNSQVDGLPREGLVFRSADGKMSFKIVDPEYLLQYHNG